MKQLLRRLAYRGKHRGVYDRSLWEIKAASKAWTLSEIEDLRQGFDLITVRTWLPGDA